VRLYGNLFNDPDPDRFGDEFVQCVDPASLEVLTGCKLEASLAGARAGANYQFLRLGYFCVDSVDSTPERPVFNRSVALKESFKK
jgi:glutaminyl-tRNA synthetase